MEDPPQQIPIAVGIIVGLLSSLVQSLGLTIQRKSHIINESRPEHLQRVETKRPLWILGFAIFITSNVLGTIFQVGALPIVVLAPLGAISLLWNAVFARVMLGDTFTRYMVIGTILISSGAVLIAIFGIVPEPTHTLEDLVRLFGRSQWITYLTVLGGFLVAVLIVTHLVELSLNRTPAIQLPISATDASGNLKLPSSPPDTPTHTSSASSRQTSTRERTRLILALSFASVSGCISGLCLLFAKSGVELLILTFGGHGNQFGSWSVVWGGGGLVVLALAQLYYINHALRLASPTIICPLAFSTYNLSSVFGGLIYFDQFQLLSSLQLGLVCLGIAVLLLGVGAVSIVDNGTGEGGVDMGVWVEEEECLGSPVVADPEAEGFPERARSGAFVGDGALMEEPTSFLPTDAESTPLASNSPSTGPLPPRLRNPFASSGGRGGRTSFSTPSSPRFASPPPSPLNPASATFLNGPRRRSSTSHRYISLLPTHPHHHHQPSPLNPGDSPMHSDEDNEPITPSRAIFSIGLGAASPGFVLRPRKQSLALLKQPHDHPHRRSGSESLVGGLIASDHARGSAEDDRRGIDRRAEPEEEDQEEESDRRGRRRSLKNWWKSRSPALLSEEDPVRGSRSNRILEGGGGGGEHHGVREEAIDPTSTSLSSSAAGPAGS